MAMHFYLCQGIDINTQTLQNYKKKAVKIRLKIRIKSILAIDTLFWLFVGLLSGDCIILVNVVVCLMCGFK